MKTFYNCEAKDLGVVWCSCNEWTNCLRVYRHLLTNPLHGKVVELCLGNSVNNRVTTTKYISTLIASSMHYSFYHVVLVKFYCEVITRSCLQLINARSTPFLVNFVPF